LIPDRNGSLAANLSPADAVGDAGSAPSGHSIARTSFRTWSHSAFAITSNRSSA